ncbi:hypothetical protein SAMN05216410_3209 [Sanguibacter gelidistatuariae]|uniref:Uncharacterized protein n=1 Tax=Sanguibacter gelidistatuariae TaxID=1814289 RepID=A0A1G6U9Q9_9MICO|nr:hypothetical protein [Sanguibacter gelidistatuariae]SDD37964.1 hypothetical protein SAMN05216410_3209 [Sanguibacter gelidistatuariae]
MNRHHLSRLLPLGVAVALIALAGCGSDHPDDSSTSETSAATSLFVTGPPDGVSVPADTAAGAGWAKDRKGEIWVLTYGSSTNPRIAVSATADGQTVTVVIAEAYPGKPATADFVPSTSYVAVPESVDSETPVTVVLGDLGTAEIKDLARPGWVLSGS